MAKEVSSNTANATIEAGEYSGVSRERMLQHFQCPEELDRRTGRVDWTEYLASCHEFMKPLGSGPELVIHGQDYLRNQFKNRNSHFYYQFTSWDKLLWVTKHYMAGRMIKGYAVDYQKLGPDYYHVTMTLDETLQGDEDFLYFLTGVWTGGTKLTNFKNTIDNLVVSPNRAEADIQFDSRSFASRAIHNPIYCRWKTWRELRRDRKEQEELIEEVHTEQKNLSSTMQVVSDAVFDLAPGNPDQQKAPAPSYNPPFFLKPDQAIDALRKTYHAGIQTQEELENTRNRLRNLFDAVSDGLFVFHKGELLLANREATRMLDKADKAALLHSIYEAGMRRNKFPGAAQNLDGIPHVLVTSCTTLQLQEGPSYLIGISDLSRALELSKHVEELTTQERRRIARDLHDGLSQLLSSLSFQAKALSISYTHDPEHETFVALSDRAMKCLKLGAKVYRDLDQI